MIHFSKKDEEDSKKNNLCHFIGCGVMLSFILINDFVHWWGRSKNDNCKIENENNTKSRKKAPHRTDSNKESIKNAESSQNNDSINIIESSQKIGSTKDIEMINNIGFNSESTQNVSSLAIEDSSKKLNNYSLPILNLSQYSSELKCSNIIDSIKSIFNNFGCYIGDTIPLKQTYEEIMKLFNADYSILSVSTAEKEIEQKLNEIKTQGKDYYFKYIFPIICKNVLNQQRLKEKFYESINLDENSDYGSELNFKESYYSVETSILFSEISSSSKVSLDKDFCIVLEKTYNSSQIKSGYIIEKEKRILKSNYSKFILHMIDENNDKSIVIPYFPLGPLNAVFYRNEINTNSIELSAIDKIIIILEITQALDDLHSNDEYHGNLCTQNIYLSSSKDAYIGLFAYDDNGENESTKPKGPLYYRSPDTKTENMQIKDIYSLGVIMHEVFTGVSPEKRMGNRSRFDRVKIMKSLERGCYSNFLFSGQNNECFNDKQDFYGFKEIINKCLDIDHDCQYHSMKEIINAIHQTLLYQNNKDEIEDRMKRAPNSSDYQCTIANLLESYYLGQDFSIKIIESILHIYDEDFKKFSETENIIKQIFETLEIKDEKDSTYVFNDIFEFLIKDYEERIVQKTETGLTDPFDTISIIANNKLSDDVFYNFENVIERSCIGIPPISSLSDFHYDDDDNDNEDNYTIWLYFVAKELSVIHSNNYYHGNLSADSIGIYYNTKTETFVPSIILFYHYYKMHNDNYVFPRNSGYNRSYESEKLEKYQRNDRKKYLKILKQFVNLPSQVLGKIEDSGSMNEIVYHLYNYIVNYKSSNVKDNLLYNLKMYNYANFQISYSDLNVIFQLIKYKKPNENILMRISNILTKIHNFLLNSLTYPNMSLKENMRLQTIQNQMNPTIDIIIKQFDDIKAKSNSLCDIIFDSINISDDIENVDTTTIEKPKTVKKIDKQTDFQYDFKLKPRRKRKQKRKWFNKILIKRLEISELYMYSFEFMMKRYLLNLNPNLNFKIIVTIKNRSFSKYQDRQIKGENVVNIANKLGFYETYYEDGYVIIMARNNNDNKQNKKQYFIN